MLKKFASTYTVLEIKFMLICICKNMKPCHSLTTSFTGLHSTTLVKIHGGP